MCLYVIDKNGPGFIPNISKVCYRALADITVYKVIYRNNTSFIMAFQYEPNTLYRLRKALQPKNYYGHYEIEEGFHAYRSFNERVYNPDKKLVKFTIPKGAKYFLGKNGDIVSTSIRSGSLKAIKGK